MEGAMFLDTTPDTSGYMIAGYAVAFGVMAIYLVSLIVRFRNLNQDQQLLEAIEREDEPKSPPSKAVAPAKAAKKPAAAKKSKPKTSVKKKK
jgi:hypothetical protein